MRLRSRIPISKSTSPKYNILLKDDKTYPYIKVYTREAFPHIGITRKVRRGDGRYFGPFMGCIAAKEIVDVAAKVYHIRTCSLTVKEKPAKPCLEYHLGAVRRALRASHRPRNIRGGRGAGDRFSFG